MFIAHVAEIASCAPYECNVLSRKPNISLRWSEEVFLGYCFYKHLVPPGPKTAPQNLLRDLLRELQRQDTSTLLL